MKNLEQLIHEEMAAAAERIMRFSRSTAVAAFEQRFEILSAGREQELPLEPTNNRQRRSPTRRHAAPRSREEIENLSNRFLDAVRAHPGETMASLAPKIEVEVAQLQVPMVRLRKAGKLKTMGHRQFTRYFPVDDKDVA